MIRRAGQPAGPRPHPLRPDCTSPLLLAFLSVLFLLSFLGAIHAQLIVNLFDPADRFSDVFGQVLHLPVYHRSLQGHFSPTHRDLDLCGVYAAVIRQAIADVFTDPLIGALIAARSPSTMGTVLPLVSKSSCRFRLA